MVMAPNPVSEMNNGQPITSLRLRAISRASAQTVATSGTITHDGFSRVRVTTAGAVTDIIVQDGLYDGQLLWIVNTSANTLTMAAVSTSKVANGVTFVIPALAASLLMWDAQDAVWYGRF